MKFLNIFYATVLIWAIVFSCKKYNIQNIAIIKTGIVSGITPSKAQALGSITNITNDVIVQHGHCWSSANDVPDYRINQGKTLLGSKAADGSFQSSIAALFPNTTYYLRSFYISQFDTIYGNDIQVFKTLDSVGNFPPNISTGADSAVTQTTAMVRGSLINVGTTNVTAFGHCYSNTNTVPTLVNSTTNLGATASPINYFSSFTGLTPSTTYYCRAYATNTIGTSYGNVVSFTTGAVATTPPTVLTIDTLLFPNFTDTFGLQGNMQSIGSSGITEKGHVLTDSFFNSTLTITNTSKYLSPTTSALGIYKTNLPLGFMKPLTQYRFRAFASNTAGTSYGDEYRETTGFKGEFSNYNFDASGVTNTNYGVSVQYNELLYFGLGQYSSNMPGVDTFGYWRTLNPSTGVFTSKARCPINFISACAFEYNSKIYVIGGKPNNFSSQPNSYVMEYNTATDSWSVPLVFNVQTFWGGVGFLIGSKYYFGLGTNSNPQPAALYTENNSKRMYVYDLVANTVTPIADVPFSGRAGATGFSIFGSGYIVGGTSGNLMQPYVENLETWQFNGSTNTWTQKASMPTFNPSITGVAYGNSDTHNGKGYVWAGRMITNNDYFKSVLRYDPVKNNWRDAFSGSGINYCAGFGALINKTLVYGGGITWDSPTFGMNSLK